MSSLRSASGPGPGESRSQPIHPTRGVTYRHAALAAIVVVGLVLRLIHIRLGLPDFIEEAIPFRRAFAMWGWETGRLDLNPHLFHYPSLSFYLQFLIQQAHYLVGHLLGQFKAPADYYLSYQIDPMPMVVFGRLLGLLSDAVTIVCVARIGERVLRGAGIVAAAMVACSPMMILTSRAIFSDSVMTALFACALERLVAYEQEGGGARLATASLLIGLAAGAKYPAGLLVVVLAWVAWRRHGVRGLGFATLGAAGALATFLATSPYVVLDFAHFKNDFAFLGVLSGEGHLGSLDRPAFMFYADLLVRDLGWPCVALCAASLALAIPHMRARAPWTTLWIALALVGVPISVAHIEAQRYLVPVIPLVALLGSLAAFEVMRLLPKRARWPVGLVLLVALTAPSAIGGVHAGLTGADDTQIQARRWCERNLGPDQLLLHEARSAELLTPWTSLVIQGNKAFRGASPELRRRYLERRLFRAVSMPLVVSGRATTGVSRAGRDPVVVRIVPHAVDLNQMFYDPRLLQGVDYVLTSGTVRARFEADSLRFHAQRRFYRTLDAIGTVVADFRPGGLVTGPEIRIYRLDGNAWAALRARDGELGPLWWAEAVPPSYRTTADSILAPGRTTSGMPFEPDGGPSPWVLSLRPLFQDKLGQFAHQMAQQMTELGRFESSLAFSAATLAMEPGDIPACLLYIASASGLERWTDARVAAERTIEVASRTDRYAPEDVDFLRVTYAKVLYRIGEPEQARRVLEEVIGRSAPGSENAERARQLIETNAG